MGKKIICYTEEKSKKEKGLKLTSLQQAKINEFFMAAVYLDDTQNAAIDGITPMTQEVFDSIMKRREEVGPELEEVSMGVFLKYPKFAQNYADRLEAEIGSVDDMPKLSPLQEQLEFERLKRRIRKEYGEKI